MKKSLKGNRDGVYAKDPWEMTPTELEAMVRKGEQEANEKGALDPIVYQIRSAIRNGVNPFTIVELAVNRLKEFYEQSGDLKLQMDRMAFISTVVEEAALEMLGKGWEVKCLEEYKQLGNRNNEMG